MNDKGKLALKKFSQAFERLQEAVAEPPSPLQADAVLQRFGFTFELLWKALRSISRRWKYRGFLAQRNAEGRLP